MLAALATDPFLGRNCSPAWPSPGIAALGAFLGSFAIAAALTDPAVFTHQLGGYAVIVCTRLAPFGIALVCLGLARMMYEESLRGSMAARCREAGVRSFPVLIALLFLMAGFTTLKTAIPASVPFWADAWLADLDEALHGGAPAAWLHEVVPPAVGDALVFAYGTPWFAAWLCAPLVVAVQPAAAWRTRFLWAFALNIVLMGVVAATALASVGPVFYGDLIGTDRFAFLDAAYADSAALAGVGSYADHLQFSYETGQAGLGSGISAMPSMHCAGAFLNAYFLSSLNRWAGLAGWSFAGAIFIGSIYTGWHYAVDGYASFVGVTLIWLATGAVSRRAQTLTSDDPHA